MTKNAMIEIIKNMEADLWLDLNKYDYNNAPKTGDYSDQIAFDTRDCGHGRKLGAWAALSSLMQALDIPCNLDTPQHNEAREFSHALFIEQQAARGIYYDENGNKI